MIRTVSGRSRPSTPRPAAAGPVTAPAAAPRFDHWSVARGLEGTLVFHTRAPQLRSEVSRELGRRCAEGAWRGIFELLREQERTGRTPAARELAGRYMTLDGVGVAGLARHTGHHRSTIDRQLRVLESMGLVAIVRPPVTMARGPDGRLIAKKGGRVTAVRIVCTYNPDVHGKPRRKAKSYGAPCTIEPAAGSGSYGAPRGSFQKSSNTTELIPPEAGTAGAGAAVADGVVVDSTGAGEGRGDAAGTGRGDAAGTGRGDAAAFEREAREGPEPQTAEDLMDVATAEILAGRKGLPSPSDPGHTPKQPPHWGRKRKPKAKRRIFELDDAEPAPAPTPTRPKASWPDAYSPRLQPHQSPGEAAAGGQAPPRPPHVDRGGGTILGAPGAAELKELVAGRRRAAADAATDRFKHEWRRDAGLPVAASTPPGRPLDAELAAMAAELDAALESTRNRLGIT